MKPRGFGLLGGVGAGMPAFTLCLCAFPRVDKGTADDQSMNTNDTHLRHRPHDEDDFRFPAPALFGLILSAIEALATLRDRLRGAGESTQLGPIPEQVIGRWTGART